MSGQPTDYPDVEERPDLGVQAGNSGHQAILLARQRLHRRIILLGFDCGFGKGGTVHFHGRHPRPLTNPGPANFGRWLETFRDLAASPAAKQTEIINSSRATAIDCFPRMTLETALALS